MHASVCGMLACMCEHVLQGHVNLCMQPLDSNCSLHSQRICSAGTARPLVPSALPAASAASATAVRGSGRAVACASVRATPPAAAAAVRRLLQRSEEGKRRPRQPSLLRCALGCSDTRPRAREGGLEYETGGGASGYRPNQCGRPFQA